MVVEAHARGCISISAGEVANRRSDGLVARYVYALDDGEKMMDFDAFAAQIVKNLPHDAGCIHDGSVQCRTCGAYTALAESFRHAYTSGRESMREEAAKCAESRFSDASGQYGREGEDWKYAAKDIAEAIRALPTDGQAAICQNCNHWGGEYGDGMGVRYCTKMVAFWNATDWGDDCERVLMPKYENQKAFVQNGSDYYASLLTKADFSCAHFEAAGK